MVWGAFRIICLAGFIHACAKAPDPKVVAAEKVLRELYLINDPAHDKPIDWGDKSITSKYFDSTLVRLYYVNKQCEIRTHEICNLDADPIYGAQDYDEKGVSVQFENILASPKMIFKVKIKNITEYDFSAELGIENGQWKILDIQYDKPGYSLLKMMSDDVSRY